MFVGGLIELKVRSQVPLFFLSPLMFAMNWKASVTPWMVFISSTEQLTNSLSFTTPLEEFSLLSGLTSTGVSPMCWQPRRLSASLFEWHLIVIVPLFFFSMLFCRCMPVFLSSLFSVKMFFVVMLEPSVALIVMYGENVSGRFQMDWPSINFSLFFLSSSFWAFFLGGDCCVSVIYFVYVVCGVSCMCVPGFGRSGLPGVGRSPAFLGEEVGVDSSDHAGRSLSMAVSASLSISREASFSPFPLPVGSEGLIFESMF